MSINLPAIKNLLQPGLMDVEGKYKEVPLELESIFTKKQTHLNTEIISHMRYVGMATQKVDGEAVTYDNQPGFVYNNYCTPISAGVAYVFTRNAIADNLYKSDFEPANLGLQNSMRTFWNNQAAYLFNTCTTYDASNQGIGGDGVALASTLHPLGPGGSGGTFATTTSTPQSLTEGSYLSALKVIPTTYVDEANLPIDLKVKKMAIPYNLKDVALRLLEAELRTASAENDPNVAHEILGTVDELVVSRFLTNPFGWFLITDLAEAWLELEREPFEMDMWVDFDTDNLKVKCYERKGYFNKDPRGGYFQFATA